MRTSDDFDLQDFLPYLLNQAAEASGIGFQQYYKDRYGMLRTEWRVLFHLGRYGEMTAKEICTRARVHKTKVSRAVGALEAKRFLSRTERPDDRRHARLALTRAGRAAYVDLSGAALQFDTALVQELSKADQDVFRRCLRLVAKL